MQTKSWKKPESYYLFQLWLRELLPKNQKLQKKRKTFYILQVNIRRRNLANDFTLVLAFEEKIDILLI